MTRARAGRLRTILSSLHRWTGLVAGPAFVMVALTGSVLALRTPPPAAPAPRPACAAPLALDAIVARARAFSPDSGRLRFLRLADAPDLVWRVRFDDGQWIDVDACSGRVLGSQALYGGAFGTVARVHIFGFLPAQEGVAGSFALLFLVAMAGAGIVLWRPTLRALKAGLRPPTGVRGQARWRGLHRTAALYAVPMLLTSALTGLPQAFHWGDQPSLQAWPGAAARGAPPVSLQRMWEQAQGLVPHARRVQIRLPAAPGMPVTFEMVGADAPHANALSYVRIAPYGGQPPAYVPYAANPAAHRAFLFAAALHYGWVGGLAGQLLLFVGALSVPLLAWTGTAGWLRGRRKRPVRLLAVVADKRAEAEDVCVFELAAENGGRLPAFRAGAHIDVHLPNGLVRQYSLCGDPRERRRYRIAVLRTAPSRGGSRTLHDEVRVGDRIAISAPKNHFPLARGAARSLLIAGGIGITPIIAMAEALARAGADFELHYCVRTARRAAFAQQLMRSSYASRVHFHYGETAGGKRLDLPALLADPDPRTHVYACGPAGFMDAVRDCALAQGWDSSRVHREHFAAPAGAPPARPFDIRIASSGAIVHVPAELSALEALARHGIKLPMACGQGLCGTCITPVLEGEPEHRDLCLDEAKRARNDCMTPCCSRARGASLTLDL
jgi:vanillate O-demethylase ferredoxin subunit